MSASLMQAPDDVARTAYVGNLVPQVTAEQVLGLFAACGPITYYKFNQPREGAPEGSMLNRFGFIEFTEPQGFINALALDGYMFYGRPLKVSESEKASVRPLLVDPAAVPMQTLNDMFMAVAKVNARLGVTDADLLEKINLSRS